MLACGTLEITVLDRTPTPDMAATGTLARCKPRMRSSRPKLPRLIQRQHRRLLQPPLHRSLRISTAPPAVPVPAATRITFLNGATVGMVNAPIQAGQSQNYVLKALKAQPMFVYVGSTHNDVTVSIKTQDGTDLLSAAAYQASWQGSLPQTEDYYLTIHGGAIHRELLSHGDGPFAYPIRSRGDFRHGERDYRCRLRRQLHGTSPCKGQNMNVDLENLSDKASLSIYGFTDGQRYLRSEKGQTSFHFVLPSTQDYIIVVVPAAGSEVSYTMTVKIQ